MGANSPTANSCPAVGGGPINYVGLLGIEPRGSPPHWIKSLYGQL